MSDKATDERLGEMQITLNALYRKMGDLERRLRRLEQSKPMTGSIEGLGEPIVVTLPEGWFA